MWVRVAVKTFSYSWKSVPCLTVGAFIYEIKAMLCFEKESPDKNVKNNIKMH